MCIRDSIFGDKTLMLLLALSAYEIFAAVFGLASFSEPIMVILVISLCTYIGVKMAPVSYTHLKDYKILDTGESYLAFGFCYCDEFSVDFIDSDKTLSLIHI